MLKDKPTVFLPGIQFQTRSHRLMFSPDPCRLLQVRVTGSLIKVCLPHGTDPSIPIVQQAIRLAIDRALMQEARLMLPSRLEKLASLHGFTFARVTVKNMVSRWGSCTLKNDINLSMHMVCLPDDLIDYILIHELAHTRVRSHGPKFWSLLESVLPDARRLDKLLNKRRIVCHEI
ncbi:MAG: M48 family metallopeptidase [Candidatus Wallbacteria bacterium]|nr:M48 family metallopeptidase [Candidatus Wallbacteria bacterium]